MDRRIETRGEENAGDSADCIEQCPLSRVIRKTFARGEFFSV